MAKKISLLRRRGDSCNLPLAAVVLMDTEAPLEFAVKVQLASAGSPEHRYVTVLLNPLSGESWTVLLPACPGALTVTVDDFIAMLKSCTLSVEGDEFDPAKTPSPP
jgi:hypothetical protein